MRCLVNPSPDSTGLGWLEDLADASSTGSQAQQMFRFTLPNATAASMTSHVAFPFTLLHGDLRTAGGVLVAPATGTGMPDNYVSYVTRHQWNSSNTNFATQGLYMRAIPGWPAFDSIPKLYVDDMQGNPQLGLQVRLTYGSLGTWAGALPQFFGEASPYNPLPCEGVSIGFTVNGVEVDEPITDESISTTGDEVARLLVVLPDGEPRQSMRLDFIPDVSTQLGRRRLFRDKPIPTDGETDFSFDVTASFQAFVSTERLGLDRMAVRCETEYGFAYMTFDGTDWGPSALDSVAPGGDADEIEMASCLSSSGIGLSPSSWVPSVGRMFSCLGSALFVPSDDFFSDQWTELQFLANDAVPFSWVLGGVEVAQSSVHGLSGFVDANTNSCVTWLQADVDGLDTEPANVCPSETIDGTEWEEIRPWMGDATWLLFALMLLKIGISFWLSNGGGETKSWYIDHDYGGGVW